jgi:hypothetical protein
VTPPVACGIRMALHREAFMEKTGESRTSKNIWGERVTTHYNGDGKKTGETRYKTAWDGTRVATHHREPSYSSSDYGSSSDTPINWQFVIPYLIVAASVAFVHFPRSANRSWTHGDTFTDIVSSVVMGVIWPILVGMSWLDSHSVKPDPIVWPTLRAFSVGAPIAMVWATFAYMVRNNRS